MSYATDADFVTANGAAVEGDEYNHTGSHQKRRFNGTIWEYLGVAWVVPEKYISGLNIEWIAENSISIDPGACADENSQVVMLNAGMVNVALDVSGEGGLDTGSEANSTWYYVWAIWDATLGSFSVILSASNSTPVMPAGYTYKRLLGTVRNNASGNLWNFQKHRVGSWAETRWLEDRSSTIILSAGTATTYTVVSAAPWASIFSTLQHLWGFGSGGDLLITPYGKSTPMANYFKAAAFAAMDLPSLGAQQLEYKMSAGSGYIYVLGYDEVFDI